MDNNELYSTKITKGSRTYYFDIKKSVKSELYLKISETKKTQDNSETFRLIIFEEDVEDFVETLNNAFYKFKEIKNPQETKVYDINKIREIHKQAYSPWAADDDSKLELLFCEGKNIKELASIFQRNSGAITSRIKKLELKEKYDK